MCDAKAGIKMKKQSMFATENAGLTILKFKMNHIVRPEHPNGTANFRFSLLILTL